MVKSIVYKNIYVFFECRCLFLLFSFQIWYFLGKSDPGKQIPFSCCYGNQTVQIFLNIFWKMYTPNFNLYNCIS